MRAIEALLLLPLGGNCADCVGAVHALRSHGRQQVRGVGVEGWGGWTGEVRSLLQPIHETNRVVLLQLHLSLVPCTVLGLENEMNIS